MPGFKFLESVQNRKFIGFVMVFITSTVLVAFGKLSGTEWVTATNIALGVFVTANVMEKKGNSDVN